MDNIQAFEALCEVQSDKASVEITSPFDGIVKELLVTEGEIAKVGAGLCLIEVEEAVNDLPVEAVSTTSSSNESKQEEETEPTQAPVERPHLLDPANALQEKFENVFALPSVRRFARENSVDLSSLVPGTGKGGRIEQGDVEAYLSQRRASSSKSETETDQLEDVVVELGRTRYGMWKAMVKVRYFLKLLSSLLNPCVLFRV